VKGKFVPAKPVPETVLVNTGDLMQRWTSDRIKAVVSFNQLKNIYFTFFPKLWFISLSGIIYCKFCPLEIFPAFL